MVSCAIRNLGRACLRLQLERGDEAANAETSSYPGSPSNRRHNATENARHSVALRSTQLTMLQLRPRRHCRRCRVAAAAEQAMRRGRRPACGCAPRGCGSATRTRRDLHEAEGELRSSKRVAVDSPSIQLVQHSPSHQNLRATYESIHVNAIYLRAVSAPDLHLRVSVRARTSRARSASRFMQSKAFISTAPVPQGLNLTTPTTTTRRRSRCQAAPSTHPK